MAQRFLDGSKACPFGHVVGSEGVSHGVDRGVLDPRLVQVFLDDVLEGAVPQGLPKLADEEAIVFYLWSDL